MLLRPARPEDHVALARLFVELNTGDPPPDLARILDWLPGLAVAEGPGGELWGYRYTERLDGLGYVRQLVVAPEQRDRGLGRRLMLDYAAELRASGVHRWCLNVRSHNARALHLYQQLGLRPVYAGWVLQLPWCLLPEPAISRVRRVTEDEATELEERLNLRPGLVHRHLQIPSRRVCVIDDGRVLGYTSFDVFFCGAFPFVAPDLGVAAELVWACRAFARGGSPVLRVVVERVEAQAELLLSVGATLRYGLSHMEGDVPPEGQR